MILARTQNEMKRAAYCAVQMIQNVSKNRTNKLITTQDLKNIARAWQIVVPIMPKLIALKQVWILTFLILIEGTENDECKVLWSSYGQVSPKGSIDSYSYNKQNEKITNTNATSLAEIWGKTVKIKQNISSTYLFPDLHIKKGEIKAVLEMTINVGGKTLAKALGLHILKPLSLVGDLYFGAHVIFTPISEIFSTTTPPK